MTGSRLRLAFLLTVVILVVEAGAGLLSHSLALLSDAGHILTDVFALGLAWFAVVQSQRPADKRRTYGYSRIGILAAMLNGATLVVIVIFIAIEAAQRFQHPEPVQGGLVIIAALIAIGVNVFIAMGLREHGSNLNVRAAMLHVIGDIAASVGVTISGAVILLAGWYYADPLISVGIAGLIAWGAVRIVMDTVNVLMEGTPHEVDLDRVRSTILGNDGIVSVHDLHVWSLDAEQLALSAHVVVGEHLYTADGEHLIRRLEKELCEEFDIGHTTVQVEACHPCDPKFTHAAGQHNHPHSSIT